MSRGVNKTISIGNCCADPETKSLPSGGAVTNITLAINEDYKKGGKEVKKVEFIKFVFFNRLAEIAGQYLKKGSKVYIEGSIRTRKWQAQDGQDRYTTEIVGKEMQMLDSRGSGEHDSSQQHSSSPSSTGNVDVFEDIPF